MKRLSFQRVSMAGILAVSAAFAFSPVFTGVALAESRDGRVRDLRQDLRDDRIEKREDVRDVMIGSREVMHDERVEFRAEQREDFQTFRGEREKIIDETTQRIRELKAGGEAIPDNLRKEAQGRIEALRDERMKSQTENREAHMEQMKGLRDERAEDVQKLREDFRKKLDEFSDARKKEITERVSENLDRLNDRLTEHYTKYLDHLEEVVNKIEDRTDKLAAGGTVVDAVRTAITNARNAIDASRTVVAAQGAKTYVITITDESKLKEDVQKVREQFHADQRAVRDDLENTRAKVREAHSALKNATSTPEDASS